MVTIYQPPQGFSTWKIRGAVFGLLGGLVAPIAGTLFTIVSWFAEPVWHRLSIHLAATSLFVMTIPLLLFGAHCLDLLEKERQQDRSHQLIEG
jgi:hypothetical protein